MWLPLLDSWMEGVSGRSLQRSDRWEPWSNCSRRCSGRHVLELRKVKRFRPFKTAFSEHLKHRLDALRVIQTAERDEDHSWEALQVGSEHPGAALRAEASV